MQKNISHLQFEIPEKDTDQESYPRKNQNKEKKKLEAQVIGGPDISIHSENCDRKTRSFEGNMTGTWITCHQPQGPKGPSTNKTPTFIRTLSGICPAAIMQVPFFMNMT